MMQLIKRYKKFHTTSVSMFNLICSMILQLHIQVSENTRIFYYCTIHPHLMKIVNIVWLVHRVCCRKIDFKFT